MRAGYCIENGEAYYCSEECLCKNITAAEWEELYADGEGDSYFTEWEEADPNAELISVCVRGGKVVAVEGIPEDVEVEVRDYDVTEGAHIREDHSGDRYQYWLW